MLYVLHCLVACRELPPITACSGRFGDDDAHSQWHVLHQRSHRPLGRPACRPSQAVLPCIRTIRRATLSLRA
eukprot:3109424-Alexandrium_andersonii.AAC.1